MEMVKTLRFTTLKQMISKVGGSTFEAKVERKTMQKRGPKKLVDFLMIFIDFGVLGLHFGGPKRSPNNFFRGQNLKQILDVDFGGQP